MCTQRRRRRLVAPLRLWTLETGTLSRRLVVALVPEALSMVIAALRARLTVPGLLLDLPGRNKRQSSVFSFDPSPPAPIC